MTLNQHDGEEMQDDAEVAPRATGNDVDYEGVTPETVGKLVQALEQKTREANEEHEKFLRTYADFENYRKRMQRDMAEFRKYANEQLVLELLSVVDHLRLALMHASENAEAADSVESLRQGVELVLKQFVDVLEKFGVQPFHTGSEQFDPNKHEAVMQEASSDVPANTVVRVFQDGYLYHEKILRHAKVSVSRLPETSTEADDAAVTTDEDGGRDAGRGMRDSPEGRKRMDEQDDRS